MVIGFTWPMVCARCQSRLGGSLGYDKPKNQSQNSKHFATKSQSNKNQASTLEVTDL